MDVSIEDPGLIQNLSAELNYRLALTLNSLTLLTFQAATAVDANVLITLANGSYLTANNIRSGVASLQAANVRPLIDESMGGLIHPFVARDVYNDTSDNGLTDILKRGDASDRAKLFDMPKNDSIVEFAGVKFKSTTTVPQVTIGGNTYYQSLIVGEDAQFSIFLGPNADGDKNYKLNIQVAPENGSVSDPARVIGGFFRALASFLNLM